MVVERWETRDDLNAHGKAPHMKVWREYSSQMKTAPTVIEIISDGKVEKFYERRHSSEVGAGSAYRMTIERGRNSTERSSSMIRATKFRASIAGRTPRPTPSCSISTTGTGGGWR